ncbi:hypothetical protein ONZ51_g1207 [Trametes cubensis]|uniref:Anaphase-promoting complex subunit 13 n=1 Tax=Trametes cubensis TaxID=1111947 RepID=A0AAD7U3A1_9APHY|nr:hypothetical protein ONZ51_g1207 [Trametes cubensis]
MTSRLGIAVGCVQDHYSDAFIPQLLRPDAILDDDRVTDDEVELMSSEQVWREDQIEDAPSPQHAIHVASKARPRAKAAGNIAHQQNASTMDAQLAAEWNAVAPKFRFIPPSVDQYSGP